MKILITSHISFEYSLFSRNFTNVENGTHQGITEGGQCQDTPWNRFTEAFFRIRFQVEPEDGDGDPVERGGEAGKPGFPAYPPLRFAQ